MVTGDAGDDCLVIVWDVAQGMPVRTLFDAQVPGGAVGVALSNDAKYLYILSSGTSSPQVKRMGEWMNAIERAREEKREREREREREKKREGGEQQP